MEEKNEKDLLLDAIDNLKTINAEKEVIEEDEIEEYEKRESIARKEVIKQAKKELKRMQYEAQKVENQLIGDIIIKVEELEEKRRYTDDLEEEKKLENQIEKLHQKRSLMSKQVKMALEKHENRLLDKLNDIGISDEEVNMKREVNEKGEISISKKSNNIIKRLIILIASKFKIFKNKKIFKDKEEKLKETIEKELQDEKEIDTDNLESKIINETEKQVKEQEETEKQEEQKVKTETEKNLERLERLEAIKEQYTGEKREKIDEAIQELKNKIYGKETEEPADNTKNKEEIETQEEEHEEEHETKSSDEKLTVNFDIKTGMYSLIDKDGCKYVREVTKEFLSNKSRNKFAIELLETYFAKPTAEEIQVIRNLSKVVDIDLYSLYEEYDRENETGFARQYLNAIVDRQQKVDEADREEMPTNIVYDLTTKGKKSDMELSKKERKLITKMATAHEKLEIAEVEKNPKMKLWQKISLALGLTGAVAALGVGTAKLVNETGENKQENKKQEQELEVVNWEDIQPKKQEIEKPSIKETLKVDLPQENKETLNKDINDKEEIKVGIGSKAILNEGTYYYSSEMAEPTGKMENRDNREVEINLIAVVGEDGTFKHCIMNGDIEKVMKENPDSKIVVHIANKDGDLGWIPYEQVRENFENNVKVQEEEER